MSAVTQPSGTVTLVFTDIEGSTRLLEELGVDAYRAALAEHRRIVREACARHGGYEVDYEGDAFFYAFSSAQAAVSAVSEAMVGLQAGPIRIRVGVHTGEPALDPPKYVGMDVHRAARIMSSAHGGQVVVSPSTVALLEPGSVALKDLGQHRLKDLSSPIPLHQLLLEGLPDAFPPLKTLYRSNLPVPATPFLGREAELKIVVARLTDPSTRLLTLTGPGGTGKTRLALQAAAETADALPDGVFWVPLAPLRDPGLVLATVAQAVDVGERADEPLVDTLASALLGKRALVVLDNTEHLLPLGASAVGALMEACPTLRLLVTSRERLQIGAETVWPVPPMSASDGERLFVERAGAAGVELTADESVRELCRRLDELPLAIQLAAARTRSLSPASILDRLDQRLSLLSSRADDVDERQRTLQATIAWSYDLLDPEEQRVLRALSVFAGGATLEAAEQVAGADLDTIESLLDKSLLNHRVDQAGQDRYWMLETIRHYASDRLASGGEWEVARRAHQDWVLEHVRAHAPGWGRPADPADIGQLFKEDANIVAAIDQAIVAGEADAAFDLVGMLGRAWLEMDRLTEVDVISKRALALPGGSAVLRAAAEVTCGYAALTIGSEEAIAHFESAEAAYEAGSMPREATIARMALGIAVAESGRPDDGIAVLEAALERMEELHDDMGVRLVRGNLTHVMRLRTSLTAEETARLLSLCRKVVEDDRRYSDPYDLVVGLHMLADVLIDAGELGEAWEVGGEALAVGSRIGMRGPEHLVELLARCAGLRGDWEPAVLLVGAHDRLERANGRESPLLDDVIQEAEAALGGETVEQLLSRGRALSPAALLEWLPSGDPRNESG